MRKSNVRRPAGKKKITASKGLWIGRQSDHALHRYYAKGKKLKHNDARTDRIIRHIETHLGIRHVATQYPVAVEFGTHRIKTHVDMVGVRGNTIVVIELKCTQNTLSVHEQLYGLPCGAGKLANHLPDTEKVHHQLQTAFGVIGMQERVGPTYKVEGCVVVSTDDAVKSYKCDDVFVRRSHFAVLPVQHKMKAAKVNHTIRLTKMPEDPEDQTDILKAVASKLKGFTEVVTTIKISVSFVVRNPRTKEHAAVALLHDPTSKGTAGSKYKHTRTHLFKEIKKSKVPLIPMIITHGSSEGMVARRLKGGK